MQVTLLYTIINNKNETYEARFDSENTTIKELEKKIVGKNEGIKIEVGKSASLLVNFN